MTKTKSVSEKELLKHIIIYTDGACSGNPGPGGWGAVVATPEGQVTELGFKKDPTTNNEMELTAILKALEFIEDRDEEVTVFTDSVYAIRGITQWIWGWMRKGWQNASGEDVKNRDVWKRLAKVVGDRKKKGEIHWRFSRGHVGTPGNERCDEIAVSFSKGKWVDLYQGPINKYSILVYDFPPDEPLPEMKPKEAKAPAFSYLSYLNGDVVRHQDWASCERRVKGQSGAKFKKAMTEAEEIGILKSWGLTEKTPIKS